MSEHDCGTVLVPIPEHMPEACVHFDSYSPEYGWDENNRACFVVDACIVDALKAVWAAGFKTLGCCCGHGQDAGGIITIDTGTFSATPRTGTQERYAEIHEAAAGQSYVTSGDGISWVRGYGPPKGARR